MGSRSSRERRSRVPAVAATALEEEVDADAETDAAARDRWNIFQFLSILILIRSVFTYFPRNLNVNVTYSLSVRSVKFVFGVSVA